MSLLFGMNLLQSSSESENQHDQEHQPQPAAGVVAPAAAVGPRRKLSHQQKHQQDDHQRAHPILRSDSEPLGTRFPLPLEKATPVPDRWRGLIRGCNSSRNIGVLSGPSGDRGKAYSVRREKNFPARKAQPT